MRVVELDRIRQALSSIDVVSAVETGFVAYSEGRAVVPPVGELILQQPPGEVHIKYGYIRGEEHYVVKIASGFYENPRLGLPSGNGLMLVFRQRTGELEAVLLDEAHLTDVRTAAAGAIAAKYLAPHNVERIGILGYGVQGRLQLDYLRRVTDCRRVMVWGRRVDGIARYRTDMLALGFHVEAAVDPGAVAASCNLIVTTTAATEPLLRAEHIRPGTHITAVGSDTADKQELEAAILGKADLVVADSISQCLIRGEIPHALRADEIVEEDLVELGHVIAGQVPGRTSEEQITVADLTGVAVQDIRIASAVLAQLRQQ